MNWIVYRLNEGLLYFLWCVWGLRKKIFWHYTKEHTKNNVSAISKNANPILCQIKKKQDISTHYNIDINVNIKIWFLVSADSRHIQYLPNQRFLHEEVISGRKVINRNS